SRGEGDRDRLAGQLAAARGQRDDVAISGELAGLLYGRPVGVAQIVEPNDHILLRQRLATAELRGPGVDARQRALALAVQALIDHPREGEVRGADCSDYDDRDAGGGVQEIAGPASLELDAQRRTAALTCGRRLFRGSCQGCLQNLYRHYPVSSCIDRQLRI